jgi:hypothetical protein
LVGNVSGYGSDGYSLVFDHTADDQYVLSGLNSDLIDLSLPVKATETANESADATGTAPKEVQSSRVRIQAVRGTGYLYPAFITDAET